MTDELILIVNGAKYTGWKNAQVMRSIEALSAGFDLSVTDAWTIDKMPRAIIPEMTCKIMYGEDLLLTGFVDEVSVSGRYQDHTVTIKGRDKTADLGDCSVIDCKASYKNVTLGFFLEKITAPYGIKIASSPILGTKIPEELSINPGDKCFDAIERACRSIGCFPTSTFSGEIVPVRAGVVKINSPLIYGKNIIAFSGMFTIENRYKNYIVLAQRPGNDNTDATAIAQVKAEATDPGMIRGRTLKIIAEKSMNAAEAKQRALWECAVRAGRSGTMEITVQGWRNGDGKLWEPNHLIDIYLPYVFGSEYYQEFLITSVNMSLDNKSGTTTQLQLRRKDSALPEPLKPVKGDPWKMSLADAVAKDLAGAR